jgi:glycosyltransferase involved in cell wall biosynthesis
LTLKIGLEPRMPIPKISAAIITKNEQNNIERCLKSLLWVHEIVVADNGSTDATISICEKYPVRLVKTTWQGFGKTKQFAVDQTSNDWVLSIDADEEITPELRAEIEKKLSQEKDKAGYMIKWRSYYVTDWINYSGWDNQYKLKLFNKTKGGFNDDKIHETVILDGPTGKMKNPLMHYTFPDFKTYIHKTESYSDIGMEKLRQRGKKPSLVNAYLHGIFTFIKMYFLKMGFMDGRIGLILATNTAFATYYKYLKFWELYQAKKF